MKTSIEQATTTAYIAAVATLSSWAVLLLIALGGDQFGYDSLPWAVASLIVFLIALPCLIAVNRLHRMQVKGQPVEQPPTP